MANIKGNRQIARTRQAITGAYLALLHEYPSKTIKIKQICERANVSRPTFYNHFQTKDEIFLTYLDDVLDEMFIEYRMMQAQNQEEAFSTFKSASTQFFRLWQSKADLYELIINTHAENMLIEKLKDHHLKVYHLRVVPRFPVGDPEILEFFISHISYVFFSVLDQWMRSGMKRKPEEMGELLAILYEPMVIESLAERYY